ncbi:MAG: Hsp20/alpha crystallin family protein [Acidobacteriota bacterium]|nr:Hsp20/alpha crystallin family protein [Acidobacteriota bacterium]
MSLVQWNPFRELSLLDRSGARVFGDVSSHGADGSGWSWVPAVDVYETDDHALVVSAELPGLDGKDVEVTLVNGVLTISGERRVDETGEHGRWYRAERAYGRFRRSFTVPQTVDAESVTAEHKDGTLRVRLPFKEEAKPHRISVKAA